MQDRERGSAESTILDHLQNHPDSALLERVRQVNQLVLHNFGRSCVKTQSCALPGCSANFAINLIPRQIIYPKFCEKHRNFYQRKRHLQQLAANGNVFLHEKPT